MSPSRSLTLLPSGKKLLLKPGRTLFEGLLKAGVRLDQSCGGKGICGKCRVHYQSPPPDPLEAEHQHLSSQELSSGMRLACSHIPPPEARVLLPEKPAPLPVKLELGRESLPVNPWPGLTQGDMVMALDLGTTNLAAFLLDPFNGSILESASLPNGQAVHGADVMSRLAYASHGGHQARREMQELAWDDICGLTESWNLAPGRIKHLVAVMNSAMASLLLDWEPDRLGRHPCQVQQEGPIHQADLEFDGSLAGAQLHLPPMLGGFVGADTTGALWAALAQMPQPPFALLDIGTNAEAAVVTRDEILCCSCAAGPAFEGGGLSAGMRAAPGAIDQVVIEHRKLKTSVIGDEEPRGIAGSGMLSLTAALLRAGAMDSFGMLIPQAMETGPIQTGPQGLEIRLYPGITVNGRDFEQFMLAKAAAAAGLEILLREAGLEPGEITRLFICGTFASRMEIEDVISVGLIPPELSSHIVSLGNAAALGAAMMACSKRDFEGASKLTQRTRHLALSGSGRFQQVFSSHMRYPF